MTQCIDASFGFHGIGGRSVVARFDGGVISSDAGAILLRELEESTRLVGRFSECFVDHRDPELIEHTVEELVKQRVFGLALGYEDVNDHDQLRLDPLLAVLVGKKDPTGQDRVRRRDVGKALAGKSTLNRLELTPVGADPNSRYKKIFADGSKIENFLVDAFLDSRAAAPGEPIILDLDATDDPLHGEQPGRFFHGYYKNYCYLPLYIFRGDHLLCAKLRPSNIDASAGSVKQLTRIVERIRERWPSVRIVIRADGGFCRENLMAWCETNDVDYVLGLPKNKRLKREIADALGKAKERFVQTGAAARVFKEFEYRTLDSWSRSRRVVAKAEHLAKGANPRFVVSSLSADVVDARKLYEGTYRGRGEAENRIKEQQLYLFADRTSCSTMRANQLRLWLSSVAYVLMTALRQFGLRETEMARAQCHTIRSSYSKSAPASASPVARSGSRCRSPVRIATSSLAFTRTSARQRRFRCSTADDLRRASPNRPEPDRPRSRYAPSRAATRENAAAPLSRDQIATNRPRRDSPATESTTSRATSRRSAAQINRW